MRKVLVGTYLTAFRCLKDRARVQLAASAQTGSPLELEYCAKLAWSLAALQCLDPQLLSLAAESLKDGQRPDDALHAWKHMLAQVCALSAFHTRAVPT